MNNEAWLGKPYYSLNAYFKNTYGEKIYKIAVDAGLTCPNRDGTLDRRGCIFCSAGGSGDFAVKVKDTPYSKMYDTAGTSCYGMQALNVKHQIKQGIARFNKAIGRKFVIYFQAYTNTYGALDYLEEIWTNALMEESVAGISIATRPDCLGKEVLELLTKINRLAVDNQKFLWIELGLQTIHEETEKYIRRHYPLSVYDMAVKNLKELEIPFIVHVILGLPGETREDMLQTVRYVNQGKPFGIKLQLLHILKNTDLAKDYEDGKFEAMSLEEYVELVAKCLENLDPSIVVHRVTGDGPKAILIAPEWSGNKKVTLNSLHKYMDDMDSYQGKCSQS